MDMQLNEIAKVQTDLFEHRRVKSHFMNNCCFGEDFAAWLRQQLADLSGFEFSGPIQEDYGWGFWATREKDKFWIALSYVGDGPTEAPARWIVSIAHNAGPNVIKNLFAKPDLSALEALRSRIRQELENKDGIEIECDG